MTEREMNEIVARLSPEWQRAFACDCAGHVLHLFEQRTGGDGRLSRCLDVARKFASGQATAGELAAAHALAIEISERVGIWYEDYDQRAWKYGEDAVKIADREGRDDPKTERAKVIARNAGIEALEWGQAWDAARAVVGATARNVLEARWRYAAWDASWYTTGWKCNKGEKTWQWCKLTGSYTGCVA